MPHHRERIYRREFWLGEVDARPAALFRAALGLLVIADLWDRLRDFHAFYTKAGLASGVGGLVRWSVFDLAPSPGARLALFLLGFVLAAAFAAGYRTRLATVLLWAFMVSLFYASPFVCSGGDAVVLVLLFWAMFADLGAAASLDVRLGRRPPCPTVAAAPIRFLQLQVAYIYLVTFFAKTGPTWWSGEAVRLAVENPDWGRGLGSVLAQYPVLCMALTWGALAVEGLFPLLVFSPWRPAVLRTLALGMGLALHAGIFFTMRVGNFSLVMPVSYLVFVPAAWLDRALPESRDAVAAQARPRARALLAGVLAAQLAAIVAAQLSIALRNRPLGFAARELALMGHHQGWYMFSPDVPTTRVEIAMPGVLTDGSAVDLVAAVAPGLGAPASFAYRRWHKLRQNLVRPPQDLALALGRFVCRRYNGERGGPKLARFELRARRVSWRDETRTPAFDVLLRQSCLSEPSTAEPQQGAQVPDRDDLGRRDAADALQGGH